MEEQRQAVAATPSTESPLDRQLHGGSSFKCSQRSTKFDGESTWRRVPWCSGVASETASVLRTPSSVGIGSDSGMEDLVRRRSTATDSENRTFFGLTVSSVVCNEVLLDTLQVG